ncbi:uncharacterized protein LOC124897009 [Capsicum annuum]|uniref:uncharacterized protein LOC124897009 n=1 Tax=Capsicum annuum TaxID=4072 RepID=UPI001FB186AA|nr:uncharacterized protein LOC124897009 [Capsicum annuum]
MLISLLMENQSKGISLKIAIYQAPGRYFFKPEVDAERFLKPSPESESNLPAASTTTKARLLLKAQQKKNNGEAFLCSKTKKRKTLVLPIILLKSDLRGFEFQFKLERVPMVKFTRTRKE